MKKCILTHFEDIIIAGVVAKRGSVEKRYGRAAVCALYMSHDPSHGICVWKFLSVIVSAKTR